MPISLWGLLALSFILASCQTSDSARNKYTPIVPKLEQSEISDYIQEIDQDIKTETVDTDEEGIEEEDLFDSTETAAKQPKKSPAAFKTEPVQNDFGIEVNERVEAWIRYFAEEDHERFQRFLDRGEKYRAVVEKVLADNDLPKELYYLAMIESGFATHARSHASAVGIWQFIKGTGTRYGLRVDYYVDERIDPLRSTEAAVNYLKDLHTVFQSWYLAMAAYNSGEMRVLGAIMRSNTRDYWKLLEKKALPKETMNYVPKVLAAAIIGNHPDRFGFKINKDNSMRQKELVSVPGRVRLADISRKIGISHKLLLKSNPHIRRSITPDGKNDYKIWVPIEYVKKTEKYYRYFASKKVRRPAMVAEQPSTYRVRKGDSLTTIASRFGVSVRHIKKMNRMRSSKIFAGQRLKIYNGVSHGTSRYRVRRGDSLGKIAAKFGVSVRSLKKINRLRGSKLYAGATLKVPVSRQTSHRVRRGESLIRIAKKYGMSVGQLKALNKLRRNRIYAGQVLKVSSKM